MPQVSHPTLPVHLSPGNLSVESKEKEVWLSTRVPITQVQASARSERTPMPFPRSQGGRIGEWGAMAWRYVARVDVVRV
jgi:hypothetical protein